jgi:hypothetical protein
MKEEVADTMLNPYKKSIQPKFRLEHSEEDINILHLRQWNFMFLLWPKYWMNIKFPALALRTPSHYTFVPLINVTMWLDVYK